MIETILTNIDLGTIIMGVFTAIATWLGTAIKKIYNNRIKNETIRTVISDCVNYVEQKSKTTSILDKYEIAKNKALNILNSKGLTITDDEIDLLIESFVNSLKKEINE